MKNVLKVVALVAVVAALAGCDLAITKTDNPDPATVGKPLTYTLEVTNLETTRPEDGDQRVENVILLDSLPNSVDFVSATPSQGTCEPADADNRVLCTLGTLEGSASATVRIIVTPTLVGTIENTAETRGCVLGGTASVGESGRLECDVSLAPASATPPVEELGIEPAGERPCVQEECDPKENNTVTITTTVRNPVAPPPTPPAPNPNPDPNACTITGTNKNDNLSGTAGRDVICGLAGNDRIRGFGGNDVLRGGADNDDLIGGDGSDSSFGGPGNDDILGDQGPDTSLGGPGNDYLGGGPGPDTLKGEADDDALYGDAGKDSLDGGGGKNILRQ